MWRLRSTMYLLRRGKVPSIQANRANHWQIDFRSPYPKAGPNPFDSPLWTMSKAHLWGKRLTVGLFFGILMDVRLTPDWNEGLNRDPYTIRLINYFFPNIEGSYMEQIRHHREEKIANVPHVESVMYAKK